jgi:hypothetical protein
VIAVSSACSPFGVVAISSFVYSQSVMQWIEPQFFIKVYPGGRCGHDFSHGRVLTYYACLEKCPLISLFSVRLATDGGGA